MSNINGQASIVISTKVSAALSMNTGVCIPSGGIELFNCANYTIKPYLQTQFLPGDYAWVIAKAKQGILERISIKKINQTFPSGYNYRDTYNRVWLEYELCQQAEAFSLVIASLEMQEAALLEKIRNC